MKKILINFTANDISGWQQENDRFFVSYLISIEENEIEKVEFKATLEISGTYILGVYDYERVQSGSEYYEPLKQSIKIILHKIKTLIEKKHNIPDINISVNTKTKDNYKNENLLLSKLEHNKINNVPNFEQFKIDIEL